MADPKDDGTRYFSLKKDAGLVTRFGTASYIGARLDKSVEGGVAYDNDAIVAIPAAEHARFAREYGRAVANGALVVRSREDYEAAVKASERATQKEVEERLALEKASEAEAAKREQPTKPEGLKSERPAEPAAEHSRAQTTVSNAAAQGITQPASSTPAKK
jgi:hypothetical protein